MMMQGRWVLSGLFFLNRTPCGLIGMWIGEDQGADIIPTCVKKRLD